MQYKCPYGHHVLRILSFYHATAERFHRAALSILSWLKTIFKAEGNDPLPNKDDNTTTGKGNQDKETNPNGNTGDQETEGDTNKLGARDSCKFRQAQANSSYPYP